MATALDVARYLIQLAEAEEEPDPLCPLRLQKLLYYVQGWHLAIHQSAMFSDEIEAWVSGPVVPTVYRHFAGFGFQSIPSDKAGAPQGLTKRDRDFIGEVWEAYNVYSATSLREMTHKETPWRAARENLAPEERGDTEITHKSMRKFFQEAVNP